MARFRKVDTRIWNDEKFRPLSERGKLIFLFMLTHPNMTSLGAMRHTMDGMAAELGIESEAFREAFRKAFGKALVRVDERASFVWLPNFLKYNKPESPNVMKAWDSALDLIPECALKCQLIQVVKDYAERLPEAFREALPEAFRKGMPNQEPEPEPEPEPDTPKPPRGLAVEFSIPAELDTPGFRAAWGDWQQHRREKRKPITPMSAKKALAELAALGEKRAIEAINHSIAKGWQGIFEGEKPATNGHATTETRISPLTGLPIGATT